jgi:hypothetical protein
MGTCETEESDKSRECIRIIVGDGVIISQIEREFVVVNSNEVVKFFRFSGREFKSGDKTFS